MSKKKIFFRAKALKGDSEGVQPLTVTLNPLVVGGMEASVDFGGG